MFVLGETHNTVYSQASSSATRPIRAPWTRLKIQRLKKESHDSHVTIIYENNYNINISKLGFVV